MDPYPIIPIAPEAANRNEPMGSKRKFWFAEPNEPWRLCKFGRPMHGEDWAEKVAAEIAGLLGIPHAVVDLAECGGETGTVTPDFSHERGTLVHGNELMVRIVDPEYPAHEAHMRTRQHTVANVLTVLRHHEIDLPTGMVLPTGVTDAADAFVGYLLLDALIGNTDRHHENWGIVLRMTWQAGMKPAELAPTFDHASSLGRELPDAERLARMDGKDRNRTVERYLERGEGRLFASEDDKRGLSPTDAFFRAAELRPAAGAGWLDRLKTVDTDAVGEVIRRIPTSRISEAASRFALRVVESNRAKLLGWRRVLKDK